VPVCAWYGRPHDALRKQQLEALQCTSRGDAMAGSLLAMHKEAHAADKARHFVGKTFDVLSTDLIRPAVS